MLFDQELACPRATSTAEDRISGGESRQSGAGEVVAAGDADRRGTPQCGHVISVCGQERSRSSALAQRQRRPCRWAPAFEVDRRDRELQLRGYGVQVSPTFRRALACSPIQRTGWPRPDLCRCFPERRGGLGAGPPSLIVCRRGINAPSISGRSHKGRAIWPRLRVRRALDPTEGDKLASTSASLQGSRSA